MGFAPPIIGRKKAYWGHTYIRITAGKQFSLIKIDGKQFSVSDIGRTNILKALHALQIIVFVETSCPEKRISAAPQSEKNYFDSELDRDSFKSVCSGHFKPF